MHNFVILRVALVALAVIALSYSSALAEQAVKFESAASRNGGASGDRTVLQGYLTRPKGAGPFPAVVLLHSCLGLPSNRRAIGEMIAGWGYVALFVDDFSTRGLKETCSVDFNEALADAYGGLIFVGALPEVDKRRIAAIGFSQGGNTALQIASARFAAAFAVPNDLAFKAAAAFYPPCANEAGAALLLPTLILIGAADEVTPAVDCAQFAKGQPAGEARLIVYPGAGHVFDDPAFAGGKRVLGMRLVYARKATEQAEAALRGFLSAKLAP